MFRIVKYTKSKYLIAAGIAGAVAFGSLSSLSAQDIPAPKNVAAAPADALKTESGLASKVLKKGTGTEKPGPRDSVTVHYTGWDKAGKMFDSSVARGEPIEFPLNQVIKGWTEGVQLMVVGEKRRLWIPAALAYGEVPSRPGAPAGDLCFDVELIKIKKAPEAPKVPENLVAPKDAVKTKSGLASKVLKKGTGTIKPGAKEYVKVHYTGWTTDGKMFDSSVMRGQPSVFALNQVIKGWTEGLQLMVAGEKRRFWIPAELAYGKVPARPGAPAGDLCFDVELIKVLRIPDAPKDVAKPPADAVKSESGVISKLTKEGKGAKPQATDVVFVNYTCWSKEGKVIDTTIPTGNTVPLPLDKIPAELKAPLLLMKVGETRRIWVPAKYVVRDPSNPEAPKGLICYDFELVKILDKKQK